MTRQGDLLFVPLDEMPELANMITDGVLAEGEVTGHLHQVVRDDLGKCKVGWADGPGPRRIVIDAIERIRVAHPEHGDIVLDKNHYAVLRQREFIEGVARQVAD